MNDILLQKQLANIVNPHVTPAGIIVSDRDYDGLVKAEARNIAKGEGDNQSRFFSNYMFQNMIAHGAREKPVDSVSFAMLRDSAKKSFVDRILIRIRKDQMKSIWQRSIDAKQKQPGFKVVHDLYDDPDFKVTDDIKKRCLEMEELIGNPTPIEYTDIYPHGIRVHNGIKDLVSRLIQAELIIDRKVIRRYHRQDGKGYASFHWLPGDTIKNVDESVREWAKKNEPSGKVSQDTMTKMSYSSGFDIAKSAYVQMVDGMVVEAYTEDEISVHISNPSDELNKWGYGESRLEISLDLTTTLLYAWTYNKELFKTNYPENILTVAGDFDKEGLDSFKQHILGEAGGPKNNWRLPVISTGTGADAQSFKVETHKLRESPKDMLFDELFRFMIMFKCAAYGAHPTVLNFSADQGTGSHMSTHDPAGEIAESKEHGLKPSLLDLCEWWTQDLIKPRYDDLKLVLTGFDNEDEKEVLELRDKRTKGWLSKNEARMEEGMKPIGDINDPKNPWNFPADAPMSTYLSTMDMLGGGEGEGGEGADNGEGGMFDGFDNNGNENEDGGLFEGDKQKGNKVAERKSTESPDDKIEKSQRETKFLRIKLED
jgi:hypothetical protein